MSLDFYASGDNLHTFESLLDFGILCEGECKAIAFWFDLQLDEQLTISSSPYSDSVILFSSGICIF